MMGGYIARGGWEKCGLESKVLHMLQNAKLFDLTHNRFLPSFVFVKPGFGVKSRDFETSNNTKLTLSPKFFTFSFYHAQFIVCHSPKTFYLSKNLEKVFRLLSKIGIR